MCLTIRKEDGSILDVQVSRVKRADIIYAMFLPVSFLLSMVPSFEGMSKRAITKLFNTILTRAGITLIITVAFSISTMLYNLSGEYPFFLTAFLQIVTFAGIYFKLGDLIKAQGALWKRSD